MNNGQKLELARFGKGKRSKLRRELFARQDEVEAQRDDFISQLEAQLQQQIVERTLFTVEWELN